MTKLMNRQVFSVLIIALLFSMCKKKTPEPRDVEVVMTPPPVPVVNQINQAFGGYYISLPADYDRSRTQYPTLLFLHGAGQMGNGSSDLKYLLNDGIGKLLNDKKFPATFSVNGKQFSFIVVSPQFSRQPQHFEVAELVGFLVKNYRIDTKRFYLAGLSMGARVASVVAGEYPSSIAALVPIAGIAINAGVDRRCDSMARHNLPVWAFHNIDDPMANPADMEFFIKKLMGFSPSVTPLLTIFDAYGHDAWTRALDPGYKEHGLNIYEWMLQYSR